MALTNFQEAYLKVINEHKEDEAEDAQLAGEIKNLLTRGGIKEDIKDAVVAMIMKKVQDHCDKMSKDAWHKGFEQGKQTD